MSDMIVFYMFVYTGSRTVFVKTLPQNNGGNGWSCEKIGNHIMLHIGLRADDR